MPIVSFNAAVLQQHCSNIVAALQQHCSNTVAAFQCLHGWPTRSLMWFSQTLKRMFESSNWHAPASSVALMWMLRRLHVRKSTLNDEDSGEYSFNFESNQLLEGPQLLSAFGSSPLLGAVTKKRTDVSAARYLAEIKICSLTLERQDWVLLREGVITMIGQISQMAVVRSSYGRTDVYLWCVKCHPASQLLEDQDAMMRIRAVKAVQTALVPLRSVAVSALSCTPREDHLEFRYVF